MKSKLLSAGNRRLRVAVASLLVACTCSGCVLVPFVNAFKQSGIAEGDRKELLAAEVKGFAEARTMDNVTVLQSYMADQNSYELAKSLRRSTEEEKVIESKIDDLRWSDDAYKASVFMKVRYYQIPYYIVKKRIEEQAWEFSLSRGWKLAGCKVTEG